MFQPIFNPFRRACKLWRLMAVAAPFVCPSTLQLTHSISLLQMRIDIDTFNVHSAQVLGSPMLLNEAHLTKRPPKEAFTNYVDKTR